MRQQKLSFPLLLLLVLVAGASAGIVASVILDRSLEEYAAGLFEGQRPAVPRAGGSSAPRASENAVESVKAIAAPSMALLTAPTLDSRLSASWITSDDAFGYGVVVSTDGWVLVHRDAVAGVANVLRGVELWIDGVRYMPTQYVADTLTDFALIKIDATNLTPAAFGSSEEVASGEQAFALSAPGKFIATSVSDVMAGGGIPLAAEKYADAWLLRDGVAAGAGVFSSEGDLWAIAGESDVVPIHYGAAFVREVIRTGAAAHAGLGATVVDVAEVLNMDTAMRQGREDGALVTAVSKEGPAAAAGLLLGDSIISVDDGRVDRMTTLAELLRLYDPGQSARIVVVRAGTELSYTVTFSDFADLVY